MVAAACAAGVPSARAGVLYGVVGDGGGNGLLEINVKDASTSLLNTLGNGDNGEGIAFNPNNRLVYHTSGASTGQQFFETIDPTIPSVTGPNLVSGSYGPDPAQELSAIEWYDPLGVFLAMDSGANWYHVSPLGIFTDMGDYDGDGGFGFMRGLAVVGNRVLSISPDSNDALIEELDPLSGIVVDTINYTVDGFAGEGGTALAYDQDTDTIYGIVKNPAGGRSLAALDLNTNDFASIGGPLNRIAGLTVVVEVSEPATAALLILGMLGVCYTSRGSPPRTSFPERALP